jgi:LPS O-antigen subunit length determinant protein (WzzB/FepE family)
MVIDDLEVSANYRLKYITRMLENLYSIKLDFTDIKSKADLETIYEAYGIIRLNIMQESQHNSYNQNSEYTKACLIQEAIHIFLSEVMPKRQTRIKKKHA